MGRASRWKGEVTLDAAFFASALLGQKKRVRTRTASRLSLARCTKKDILLFCVIEGIFSFINQESR